MEERMAATESAAAEQLAAVRAEAAGQLAAKDFTIERCNKRVSALDWFFAQLHL